MEHKQKILLRLNQNDDVVSGEALSAELGISRVSIWKHIRGLIQSGVPIISSPKGYRIYRDPDCLSPWAFESRKERIHFFQETASTMDEAMRLARGGCPDFSVVVAERQSRGRGRMQRSWLSVEGGLYFTVVIRPKIPVALAGLVNLAAAVDMVDVLNALFPITACLKWPNDILVDELKICGILSQMEAEGDQVAQMNIGIGLNANNRPEGDMPSATSLRTLIGQSVPRREILVAFLDAFERRILAFDPQAIIEAWKTRTITLGKQVRVTTVGETHEGRAMDVDDMGGLVLQLADGSRQTVVYGDCFHN